MLIAGWRELVELPDWGIARLRGKLDTGARTSCLHVEDTAEHDGEVTFSVVPNRRSDRRIRVVTSLVRRVRVRSSNGGVTTRFVVRTQLRLGPLLQPIEITLMDRGAMIHRLLIGRSSLEGVAVDSSRRYLLSPLRAAPSKEPR